MFIEPSTNALIKRINRKLAYQGEKLHVTRGKRARPDPSAYWINNGRNLLVMTHVNLELLARELGVLA